VHGDVIVSLNGHREGILIKHDELRRQLNSTVARRRAAAHWDSCLGRYDSGYNRSRVDEIVRERREEIITIVHYFHCEHIERHESLSCVRNNLHDTRRRRGTKLVETRCSLGVDNKCVRVIECMFNCISRTSEAFRFAPMDEEYTVIGEPSIFNFDGIPFEITTLNVPLFKDVPTPPPLTTAPTSLAVMTCVPSCVCKVGFCQIGHRAHHQRLIVMRVFTQALSFYFHAPWERRMIKC